MKNLCEKFATMIFTFAGIQCVWIFLMSIWQTWKAHDFGEMICMILLPPVSQIYYFFESWIRVGLSHSFCVEVLNLLLFVVVGVAALLVGGLLKKRISNIAAVILLAIITIWAYVGIFQWGAKERRAQKQADQIASVLGVKFGDKPTKGFWKIGTKQMFDIYEFKPSASFRNYDHYCVNVSKTNKRVFCIRAQKNFETEDESEKELIVLQGVLAEKYKAKFEKYNNTYVAVNGNETHAQLLVIASGQEDDGKHIVIFSVMDSQELSNAAAEIGLNKEDLLRDANAL